MKKIIVSAIVLLLIGVICIGFSSCKEVPITTNTPDTSEVPEGEGLAFTSDGNGYTVIGIGSCTDTDLVIPSTYNGKPVTGIGREAFVQCISLKSVVIPGSVTIIGEGAFGLCGSLMSVTILNGVQRIGEFAFTECTALTSITVPDSVTYVGAEAFSGCSRLVYNEYQGGRYLGNAGNPYLVLVDTVSIDFTSFEIAFGTKIICPLAFDGCSLLITLTIPNGVTSIGDGAFKGCTALTGITMPDSVTSVGLNVFAECSSLKYNEYKNGRYLGNAQSLYVILVDTVSTDFISFEFAPDTKTIYSFAFEDCVRLTTLVIPDGVTDIMDYAFKNCAGLTDVVIPKSVTSIGYNVFQSCNDLTVYCAAKSKPDGWSKDWNLSERPVIWSYTGESTTPDTSTIPDTPDKPNGNGLAFEINEEGTGYTVVGIGTCTDTAVVIPETYKGKPVTEIGEGAFRGCSSITSIKIPDSVTHISGTAFVLCSSLEYNEYKNGKYLGNLQNPYIVLIDTITSDFASFEIANTTKTIGYDAFAICKNLTSITIPESVTHIGNSAFRGCDSLTGITIPHSVTKIGLSVFWSCQSLTSIEVDEKNTVYSGSGNCLIETASKTLIAGCQASVIPSDGSVTSIGPDAFGDCTTLTGIIIPDGVTSIGDAAFLQCTGLTNIEIPDSVTSIGKRAFDSCNKLTSIDIPDNVTSIGNGTFSQCYSLTSITIPDGVTSIGDSAFSKCYSLTSITIPNGVTSIGTNAFQSCSRLTSIVIPDSVTNIGKAAFGDCGKLPIYCEAESQPDGWDEKWNIHNCPVVWGCKGE